VRKEKKLYAFLIFFLRTKHLILVNTAPTVNFLQKSFIFKIINSHYFCSAKYDPQTGRPTSGDIQCFTPYVPGYSDEAFVTVKPEKIHKLFTDLKDYEANRNRLEMTAYVGLYKLGPKNFIECQELCQNVCFI
jgi:hypothetical protein